MYPIIEVEEDKAPIPEIPAAKTNKKLRHHKVDLFFQSSVQPVPNESRQSYSTPHNQVSPEGIRSPNPNATGTPQWKDPYLSTSYRPPSEIIERRGQEELYQGLVLK